MLKFKTFYQGAFNPAVGMPSYYDSIDDQVNNFLDENECIVFGFSTTSSDYGTSLTIAYDAKESGRSVWNAQK